MIDILEKAKEEQDKPCKGIYFRYTYSSYISSYNSIEFKQSFRLLKRKSCPGCNKCQQLWEDFSMTGNVEDTVHLPSNLENNAIYKAIFVSGGINLETGYLDDWWWELKKV